MRVTGHSVFSIKSMNGTTPVSSVTPGRPTLSMEDLDEIVNAYDPGIVWVDAYLRMKERRLRDLENIKNLWSRR